MTESNTSELGKETVEKISEELTEEPEPEEGEVEEKESSIKKPIERKVLNDQSLGNLAELLGPKLGLTIVMYMNVPTSRLVYMRTDCTKETGQCVTASYFPNNVPQRGRGEGVTRCFRV